MDRINALAEERQRHWGKLATLAEDLRRLAAAGDVRRLARVIHEHGLIAERVELITRELNGHSYDLGVFGRKPRPGDFGAFGTRRKARRAKA